MTKADQKPQKPHKGNKLETIMGWRIAPPRLTVSAYMAALKYVALPLLTGLALLDIALYFLFDRVFGSCYGVLCLF